MVRYDSQGIFSSPRALFMFRAFGHNKSSVLDGGLYYWQSQGKPIESGPPAIVQEADYPPPELNHSVIRSKSRHFTVLVSISYN